MAKRKASAEEEDNDVESIDEANDETDDVDPGLVSPEGATTRGMGLRSGRKKRRRSAGTTGLTPPNTVAKRARRARAAADVNHAVDAVDAVDVEGEPQQQQQQEQQQQQPEEAEMEAGDGEDDTEMPGDDDDDDVNIANDTNDANHTNDNQDANTAEDVTMEATATTMATTNDQPIDDSNGVSNGDEQPQQQLAPNDHQPNGTATHDEQPAAKMVQKLRLPSQHTPGNLHETERITTSLRDAPNLESTRKFLFSSVSAAASTNLDALPPTTNDAKLPHAHTNGDAPSISSTQAPMRDGSSTINPNTASYTSGSNINEDVMHFKPNFADDDLNDDPYQQYRPETEYDDFIDLHPVVTRLANPLSWFAILLALQVIFHGVWINPILSSVMTSTNILLYIYGHIFPTPNRTVIEVSPLPPPAPTPEIDAAEEPIQIECQSSNIFNHIAELDDSLKPTTANQNAIRQRDAALDQRFDDLRFHEHNLLQQQQSLQEIHALLTQALQTRDPTAARHVIAHFGVQRWQIVDTSSIPLWDVADPPQCPDDDEQDSFEFDDDDEDYEQDIAADEAFISQFGREGELVLQGYDADLEQVDDDDYDNDEEEEAEDSNGLVMEDLVDPSIVDRKLRELRLVARQTALQMRRSRSIPGQIRESVKQSLAELGLIDLVEEGTVAIHADIEQDDDGEEVTGLASPVPEYVFANITELDAMIEDLIDVQRADRTGELDYASILMGAKVIRSGPRATSSSLVDTLPAGNRLMALTGLKFYGYGPEAALVPTYPVHSPGQCWSFVPDTMSKKQRREMLLSGSTEVESQYKGQFGTLTIQLARPIHVTSIVLEHPPVTAQQTAIRDVRVIGYTSPDATGKSWHIGAFSFTPSNGDLQELHVATMIADSPVPPLRSITLAIDTNWGGDYTCLYRFRVHGTPPSE